MLGPPGEKETKCVGALVLAFGPGNLFDSDAAGFAIDAAHAIAQAHGDVPEGNEVKGALVWHVIVGGSLAAAV